MLAECNKQLFEEEAAKVSQLKSELNDSKQQARVLEGKLRANAVEHQAQLRDLQRELETAKVAAAAAGPCGCGAKTLRTQLNDELNDWKTDVANKLDASAAALADKKREVDVLQRELDSVLHTQITEKNAAETALAERMLEVEEKDKRINDLLEELKTARVEIIHVAAPPKGPCDCGAEALLTQLRAAKTLLAEKQGKMEKRDRKIKSLEGQSLSPIPYITLGFH